VPRCSQHEGERGAGLFSTAFGFTVFLIFLLFAVQVLFGLYARTTVTAATADLANRIARDAPGLDRGGFDAHAASARARLGGYGDRVDFAYLLLDADTDGIPDTVAVTATAELPVLLPVRWSGASPHRFSRTMRSRLEVFQEDR
jgi:Flp pilus assembly protein TadG